MYFVAIVTKNRHHYEYDKIDRITNITWDMTDFNIFNIYNLTCTAGALDGYMSLSGTALSPIRLRIARESILSVILAMMTRWRYGELGRSLWAMHSSRSYSSTDSWSFLLILTHSYSSLLIVTHPYSSFLIVTLRYSFLSILVHLCSFCVAISTRAILHIGEFLSHSKYYSQFFSRKE